MNDRFKFRAYDTDKKLMVYCWSEATEAQKNKYCEIYGKDESYYCWQSCELDCLGEFNNEYNHFIVEQCTGLKDKNGRLIYENDLIKCPSGIYRIAVDDFGLWTVIYNNNPFEEVGEWGDVVKEYAFNQNNIEIEVLGNIHENADLLEVGGK
jgi:uncharacterized phage protein (TIGR01671 family)